MSHLPGGSTGVSKAPATRSPALLHELEARAAGIAEPGIRRPCGALDELRGGCAGQRVRNIETLAVRAGERLQLRPLARALDSFGDHVIHDGLDDGGAADAGADALDKRPVDL